MPRISCQNNTNLSLNYCYNEILKLVPNLTKQDFGRMINSAKQNIGQRMKRDSMLTVKELDLLKNSLEENGIPSKFLGAASIPFEQRIIQVPVRSEVELSCGAGSSALNETASYTVSFDIDFIRDLGGSPDAVSIVKARGDSMEDKISSGDSLIIDETRKNINDGMIYAFVYDSELYCKKLQKRPGGLTAISLNKEYAPFDIELERGFYPAGQVIGVIKKIR